MTDGPNKDRPGGRRRWRVALLVGALIALLAAAFVGLRYGALLPQARLLIEARTNGLELGRFGSVRIEGLKGDVWDSFSIARVTISDERGVWLEARQVRVDWDYLQLLRRRLAAETFTAERVRLLRRPTLKAKSASRGLPITFDIDHFAARVEMTPAFSVRRGVYDVVGSLELLRGARGQKGHVIANSVLHPGDRLDARFDLGGGRPLLIDVDGVEARGGALAGALGLSPDRPFVVSIDARGRMAQGGFRAIVRTGEATVLKAQGRWSPEGGEVDGGISLTASTLTRPLAERLGETVSFEGSGRAAADGLYDLVALLRTPALVINARGRGDVGAGRTDREGVRIVARAPSLAKIAPEVGGGPALIDARLTGARGAWNLRGLAEGTALSAGGYTLGRSAVGFAVSGRGGTPVRISANLAGAGGRGEGPLTAMLGPAPRATLEGSRQTDGQLVLRRLDVRGQNLRLSARGRRGAFGGVRVEGELGVSEIAGLRPGGRGSVRAGWHATQARVGTPWTFRVQAHGRNMATGFAELDRLLGPAPDLTVTGSLQGRIATLSRAALDGRRLNLNARGAVGPDTYALNVSWNAAGPVNAGPLEISGRMDGSGTITGPLATPTLRLSGRAAVIDIPRLPLRNAEFKLVFHREEASSANFSLAATSPYGTASASVDLAFPRGSVVARDLSVAAGGLTATGSAVLRRGQPSSADLRLDVGPGAFLKAGRIEGRLRVVDANPSPRVTIVATVVGAVPPGADVTIRQARISAEGPLDRLPYHLDARGRWTRGAWSLEGGGVFTSAQRSSISFSGSASLGGRQLQTLEPAIVRFGDGGQEVRARLAADGGRLEVDGRRLDKSVDLRAQAANLELAALNPDLAGRVAGTLRLTGKGSQLSGDLGLRLSDARARGDDVALGLDGTITGRLAGDRLTLVASASNAEGLRASGQATLPVDTSAAPLRLAIDRRGSIGGRFSADGQVKPLWDLLVGGERTFAGRVRASGTLGGTLAAPAVRGQASLADGRFVDGPTGLVLTNLSAAAAFDQRGIDVRDVRAGDGAGGRLQGSGRIGLDRDGVSSFRADLVDFQLIDNEIATASASGRATVNRDAAGRIRLEGALRMTQAEIAVAPLGPPPVVTLDVIEINKPPELDHGFEPRAGGGGPTIALDVDLDAPRRVFVRGRGLDVELSLDAHVGGTTAAPLLSGVARVVRGEYQFAGKRFEFEERGSIRLATDPQDIRLDLRAIRETPTLTAVIQVGGVAARPEISLSSTPALPEDEVLSQVLFGRSASQLSGWEAAQLAAAVTSLARGGGFDVLGQLRRLGGLDRLALLGGGLDSGLTIAGGKYLADDVYLEIIGGGREGPAVQVEWRIGHGLSIVSRLVRQGDTKLSVRWRRDY